MDVDTYLLLLLLVSATLRLQRLTFRLLIDHLLIWLSRLRFISYLLHFLISGRPLTIRLRVHSRSRINLNKHGSFFNGARFLCRGLSLTGFGGLLAH